MGDRQYLTEREHGSFLSIILMLIRNEPWAVKGYRSSDPDKAMIMDCTGQFLVGPLHSRNKDEYVESLKLCSRMLKDDNWACFVAAWD